MFLPKFVLPQFDVDETDILTKKDLKHVLGGYSIFCCNCDPSSWECAFTVSGNSGDIQDFLFRNCGGEGRCYTM